MVMTSPPYWNLRDYDHDDQLGLEETPEEYVENIADVMDEVKRVLRDDGSLWLNLGDTYDDKDLQQIPARVALELQSRGWVLRNRVTWAKPNPMPQSVKDRLNDTTEAVFHFVKSKDYWYDLDAIREEYSEVTKTKSGNGYKMGGSKFSESGSPGNHADSGGMNDPTQDWDAFMNSAGKNPGDVFEVTTKPYPDAHFAVYPPELCEKPIKATCPPRVCADCGSPYGRVTEKTGEFVTTQRGERGKVASMDNHGSNRDDGKVGTQVREFKGWRQACECATDATRSGIALDPFAGAGTTLLKAKELGRKCVGVELNPEYADMARARVGLTPHDPSRVRSDDTQRGIEEF
jgi:DNA modification methylase